MSVSIASGMLKVSHAGTKLHNWSQLQCVTLDLLDGSGIKLDNVLPRCRVLVR